MSNPFTMEWCRLSWQVLLYLEAAYDYLNDHGVVIVRGENWGAGTEEGGEEEAMAFISFEAKPANLKNIKGNLLEISFCFTDKGIEDNRPIWIEVLRNDPRTWQQLKGEFQESFVHETDECWAVGLEWTLPENATNQEVLSAGRTIAERITKVLISPEGKNGT